MSQQLEVQTEFPKLSAWVVERWRLVLSVLFALGGFISLLIGWLGVSDTREVTDQLSYLASGGLIGLSLIAVAAILHRAEQRERELVRLQNVEMYLLAIADSLGLLASTTSEPVVEGESAEALVSVSR